MDYLQPQDQDLSSSTVWNNFFLSAGIPSSVAHEYAVTFSQHRIRIDMLKDITKEILIDMGIKAMGDIIAILRHAKNLYTQDELKGGIVKTTTTINRQPDTLSSTTRPNLSNHIQLLKRPPIVTKPGTSSLVGNKVQSRLSLNSGALIASSNSHQAASHNTATTDIIQNSKRTSSSLSASMAKRLKPGPITPALTEKTLTVHYPSSAAIAKARQRIMTDTSSSTSIRNSNSSSVKSRLGTGSADSGSGDDKQRQFPPPRFTSSKNWSREPDRKGGSGISDRNDRLSVKNRLDTSRRDNTNDHQSGRLRSTVFKRLGHPAR